MIILLQIYGWLFLASAIFITMMCRKIKTMPVYQTQPAPCGRIHHGPCETSVEGTMTFWRCLNCGKFMEADEALTFFRVREVALISIRDALKGAASEIRKGAAK
jgi:hypothetical protein